MEGEKYRKGRMEFTETVHSNVIVMGIFSHNPFSLYLLPIFFLRFYSLNGILRKAKEHRRFFFFLHDNHDEIVGLLSGRFSPIASKVINQYIAKEI